LEKAPDGGKDENVFDIQQGVAILLAIKSLAGTDHSLSQASVNYAELWGRREIKYAELSDSTLNDIAWKLLQPNKPYYLFIPQDTNVQAEYKKGWSINELMNVNSSCMNTARDGLVIDVEKEVLSNRIKTLVDPSKDDGDLINTYGIVNTGWWNFNDARKDLFRTKNWHNKIIKCLYRPFDERWLFHHKSFIDRPRTEINANLVHENLSLVTTRQTKEPFAVVATDLICGQHKIAAVYDRSYFFPLYLYTTPEDTAGTLFAQSETTRKANLAPAFLQALEQKLGLYFVPDGEGDGQTSFGPEDVFHYAYAVFHSPTYRKRYAELLKIDFPRLPLTTDRSLFFALVKIGKALVALHLLKSPLLEEFITSYPIGGDNRVEKVALVPNPQETGESLPGYVYINTRQYFGGIPAPVWSFKVGGYAVCEKWLKDRKGRVLSSEDINHYQRVIVALQATLRLMAEIDTLISTWPMV
jgi:predicted helicase